MGPRNFFHLHCQCTRPRRTLNQLLVLNMAKARKQAVFLTQRLLGISDTEYIALRAPACARVACQQLHIAATTDNGVVQVWYKRAHIRNARQILSPEDVQKTLIGLTQEDLRQVHRDAVPRHS